MKVVVPFLMLTGAIWNWGLQSPEESNPAISYASPEKAVENIPLYLEANLKAPQLPSQTMDQLKPRKGPKLTRLD
ncbi:hypothetical protein [Adhaeribacter pallidiroseus]|uniref:Uncharacterized protein n=1 Tax=Adhaeribacter pallidiroseus TaxID=2072847 RepID=A0A369QE17_9BACT|nr:hypothetical protein [Adhaeribacter pallidiroseus]RDC62662.1 hypothetical protein AHMF7616_01256 [Adhaeribacter pallidiroseus]